jgi:ABC-type lipoprotein export system ATPase subunit
MTQIQDIFIAVMGVTGAGKSTFISHCVAVPDSVEIGDGLQSCSWIFHLSRHF